MANAVDIGGKIALHKKVPACPVCQESGQKVNNITVRSLIKADRANHVSDEEHFICLTPECSVSYYTGSGDYFEKKDLSVPIWFKEESPVTICYCKDITDETILNHIVDKKCCANIEDIQLHTGANTGKDCLTKNPTGK